MNHSSETSSKPKPFLYDILLLDSDLKLGCSLTKISKANPIRNGKSLNFAQIWSHYHLLQVPQWEFACGVISESCWESIQELGSRQLQEKLEALPWVLLTDNSQPQVASKLPWISRQRGPEELYQFLVRELEPSTNEIAPTNSESGRLPI